MTTPETKKSPVTVSFDVGSVVPMPTLPVLNALMTVPPIPTSNPLLTLKFWSAKVQYPRWFLFRYLYYILVATKLTV